MVKPFRDEEILGKPLSEKQKRELLALEEARDEDIDTSDVPETLVLSTMRGSREEFSAFSCSSVNVKTIRTKSGLSQAEFAKRYGTVRTLQDWESRDKTMRKAKQASGPFLRLRSGGSRVAVPIIATKRSQLWPSAI